MPLTESELQPLVVALLSVNQYPLAKIYEHMPNIRRSGLLEPETVIAADQGEMIQTLADCGYDRGGFLPILTFRLGKLMEAVSTGQLDGLPAARARGDAAAFEAILRSLHGFGPTTSRIAWQEWHTA